MDKIKDSIFKFLRLDNLVENLSGYVETRIELVKLEVREEIAKYCGEPSLDFIAAQTVAPKRDA